MENYHVRQIIIFYGHVQVCKRFFFHQRGTTLLVKLCRSSGLCQVKGSLGGEELVPRDALRARAVSWQPTALAGSWGLGAMSRRYFQSNDVTLW